MAHNYKQQGKSVLLLKPSLDDRFGADDIKSRAGLQQEASRKHNLYLLRNCRLLSMNIYVVVLLLNHSFINLFHLFID